MDFLEFGKSIEKSGIQMYGRLAVECRVPELSTLFKVLANEESRHFEILDIWQKSTESPDVNSTRFLGEPEELFRKLCSSRKSDWRPMKKSLGDSIERTSDNSSW